MKWGSHRLAVPHGEEEDGGTALHHRVSLTNVAKEGIARYLRLGLYLWFMMIEEAKRYITPSLAATVSVTGRPSRRNAIEPVATIELSGKAACCIRRSLRSSMSLSDRNPSPMLHQLVLKALSVDQVRERTSCSRSNVCTQLPTSTPRNRSAKFAC